MRSATFMSNEGDTYRDVHGTIRNTGSGWEVIDNATHEPLDLSVGTVTNKYIQVLYPTAAQVVSFLCGPDEAFAKPPYSAVFGATVGLSHAYIYGTVNGSAFNPQAWSHASANIWVAARFLV